METQRKLSLRRVEMSLSKFNEVAVPHHLDLLRQHKNNIIKFGEAGELSRVRSEQLNARRIISQLRHLLAEMEQLRRQVREEDLDKFDTQTQQSRSKTMKLICDYLDHPPFQEIPTPKEDTTPSASVQSTVSTDSIGTVLASSVQLVVDRTELEQERLKQKEECLKGWLDLQHDMEQLYTIYVELQRNVEAQRSHTETISDSVESAAVNVDVGRRTLAKTERLKLAMYPLAGAVLGGCLAGPIGLVAGIKVASAALIGGSILGFTGGSFLKKKQETVEGVPLQIVDGATENKKEK